jgi:hypothetical protein
MDETFDRSIEQKGMMLMGNIAAVEEEEFDR